MKLDHIPHGHLPVLSALNSRAPVVCDRNVTGAVHKMLWRYPRDSWEPIVGSVGGYASCTELIPQMRPGQRLRKNDCSKEVARGQNRPRSASLEQLFGSSGIPSRRSTWRSESASPNGPHSFISTASVSLRGAPFVPSSMKSANNFSSGPVPYRFPQPDWTREASANKGGCDGQRLIVSPIEPAFILSENVNLSAQAEPSRGGCSPDLILSSAPPAVGSLPQWREWPHRESGLGRRRSFLAALTPFAYAG